MLAYRPDIIMLANHFWPVVAAKAGRLFGGQGRIVITSQVGWWYVTKTIFDLGSTALWPYSHKPTKARYNSAVGKHPYG
jgi:hypothetical protein